MVVRVATVAFEGIEARPVDVQVQIANGNVVFTVVGLGDKAVAESRERVRAALNASGLAMPAKRITVNLAPADLPKEGSHYDLPIALGMMAAIGAIPPDSLANYTVLGELALDGTITAVAGVLPAAIAANARGHGLICPHASGPEAAWAAQDIDVLAPLSLIQLANHFKGTQVMARPRPAVRGQVGTQPDLADIKGQESAKRALEIAAAGGHNLLLNGPPGAGKSMLAARLPSILPRLSPRELLEVSLIHSIAGDLAGGALTDRRPFRAPHHSASMAALVGGGTRARPGEISLAHHGVLFLDELPEFQPKVLDSLRQPLETGEAALSRAGRHSDGGGLYLFISTGGRRWIFRFTVRGRVREMGLGGSLWVSLAEARKLAGKAREAVRAGYDPIDARRAGKVATASRKTFGELAEAAIVKKEQEGRNAEHRRQWRSTLETYAAPLWDMPVDMIDTANVLGVLQPIWAKIPETASRFRARIEAVLDAARARGLIAQDKANPARWKGHLDKLLPKRGRLSRGHHAAMPYASVPVFMVQLRQLDTMASMALQFAILTAARSGEAIGARWNEIDLGARTWTIPAQRMKAGATHRVPLAEAAMAIIERLAEVKTGEFVFPGQGRARHLHLSGGAIGKLVPDATVHGFRSSFRDWAGEETSFPREIAEAALAHRLGDVTELAYRRGDALERRRGLMDAWAQFVEAGLGSHVVRLAR